MVSIPSRFIQVTVKAENDQKVFTNQRSVGPRIDFNIVKGANTGGGGLNTCQVSIFNLSDDTSAFILDAGSEIIVEAGYEFKTNVIYAGELKSIYRKKEGPDIVTTMLSITNGTLFENKFVNETFTKITLNELLDKLAADNGFQLERDSFTDQIINRTYIGDLRSVLGKLSYQYNFQWTSDDQVIKVTKRARPTTAQFEFTPASGLLGIPEVTEKGVDLTVFLEPNIKPSDVFHLSSRFASFNLGALEFVERVRGNELQQTLVRNKDPNRFSGDFRVMQLIHEGSTHENQWQTRIEAMLTGDSF